MPSVIIPAHNEEALIGECLRAVLADSIPDLEVIVIPNACTDRTAEVAQGFGSPVTVIETETPGKTNAVNLGEQSTTLFPRVFLDGDIVLKPGALKAIFAALESGKLIASPPPEFDTAGCDLGVRLFYKSLRANQYFGHGAPNGSGVFAITQDGRTRWDEFPKVIADDGFVELNFSDAEAGTTDGPAAIVRAPKTFRALLKIKTRARLGQIELCERFPELVARREPSPGRTFRRMLASPGLWPAIPVYGFVRIYERRAAKKLAAQQGFSGWLRDDTSRQPVAHVAKKEAG